MSPKQVERQPCKVFSRVNGWLTETSSWNPGKQSEWKDRITYDNAKK